MKGRRGEVDEGVQGKGGGEGSGQEGTMKGRVARRHVVTTMHLPILFWPFTAFPATAVFMVVMAKPTFRCSGLFR
jgi:hypothetical protein